MWQNNGVVETVMVVIAVFLAVWVLTSDAEDHDDDGLVAKPVAQSFREKHKGEYIPVLRLRAVKSLENAGYTDVEVLEKHWIKPGWFECSSDWDAIYKCEAIDSDGQRVVDLVCSNSFFKKLVL